jgi:hypothetical protein
MSVSEKKLIKNQIQLLSNQVQQLEEQIQQRLMKIEQLELAIRDHDNREYYRCLKQELDYPRRVRELELEIKETTQAQVTQMRQLYYDRIQYAKDMTQVQQATAASRADLQQALKVERQNRKDAVEKQRIKQRLLAKEHNECSVESETGG